MPTYSYACTQCDNRFDIVQSFSDDALTVCSECSGKLRKLFNSVGIVFKGSGFYRNDSRDSKAGSSVTASSDSSSKSESSSSSDSAKKSETSSSTPAKPSTTQAVAS
ncbi:FmdB family zinc ribbon protein [Antrihabitans sp. YC2-6]|uniref:FmdB family zinc ribbon protein n=1 Tax=Antrihabitans sp. YC2-6 TaxID=2799498 RepID=UPI0018F58658|nr:FmdB family zinc ribbon protein [Antrihabitans sp. YC2-6]MBJ8344082.1 FmdB family transcriptional regulator [Antrihabitans sp. YC2-6]